MRTLKTTRNAPKAEKDRLHKKIKSAYNLLNQYGLICDASAIQIEEWFRYKFKRKL